MDLSIGQVALTGAVPEESVQDLRGTPEALVQETAGIGARNVVFQPRGNKKTTLTFTIERVHASAEAAADFCVRHEAQFPVQGLFTYHTAAGELYLPGAVAAITQYSFRGATTAHAYRVAGGGFLTKLPAV